MGKEKASMILFYDWFPVLNAMDPGEAMAFLNALKEYDQNGSIPGDDFWMGKNTVMKGVFEQWIKALQRNNESYQLARDKKRLGGLISSGKLPQGATLKDLAEYDIGNAML